jgi:hypothetical protein
MKIHSDAEYVSNLLQEDLEKTGCKDAIVKYFLIVLYMVLVLER